jgi:uncharacterized protein Yka (UPF0111/DUF47 family)
VLFRKEKEVSTLLIKHLETVEECIKTGIRTIQEYLSGNIENAKELSSRVDSVETRADAIRSEVRDKLYAGAYLPRFREDIYRLVEAVDEVANAGEACCDFFLNQRPAFLESSGYFQCIITARYSVDEGTDRRFCTIDLKATDCFEGTSIHERSDH